MYRDFSIKSHVVEEHPENLTQGYHYDGGDPLVFENDRAEEYYSSEEDSGSVGGEETPSNPPEEEEPPADDDGDVSIAS